METTKRGSDPTGSAPKYIPTSFKDASFTAARLIVRHLPPVLANQYTEWFFMLLDHAQWVGFALNPTVFSSAPSSLAAILQPARALWLFSNYPRYAFVNYLTASLIIALGITFAVATHGVFYGTALSRRMLSAASATCTLLITVFRTQVLQLLVSGIDCSSNGNLTVFPTTQCSSSAQVAVIALDVIALMIFVPCLYFGPILLAHHSPKSPSMFAATRAAPTQYLNALAATLVVLDRLSQLIDPANGSWALTIVALVGLSHPAFRTLFPGHAPALYSGSAIVVNAGLYSFSWALMLLVVATREIQFANGWIRWLVVLGVPAGFGLLIAAATWRMMARRAERSVRMWFQVARGMAAPWTGLIGAGTLDDGKITKTILDQIGRSPADGQPDRKRRPTILEKAKTSSQFLDAKPSAARAHGVTMSMDAVNLLKTRQEETRTRVFDRDYQIEFAIRFVRYNPTASQRSLALHLLYTGLDEFPDSIPLKILAAQYLTHYFGSQGVLAAMRLLQGLVPETEVHTAFNSLPLTQHFQVWCFAFEAEKCSAAANSLGTGISLGSTQLALTTRQFHLESLHASHELWEAVRTNAGTQRISISLRRLSIAMCKASRGYRALVALNPYDAMVLKKYAGFVSTVEADHYRAVHLLEAAANVTGDEEDNHQDHGSGGMRENGKTHAGGSGSHEFVPDMDAPAVLDYHLGDDQVGDKDDQGTDGDRREVFYGTRVQRSGSVSSAGSTTHRVARKTQLRVMLYERFMAPLRNYWLLLAFAVGFLVTLSGGLTSSLGYFDTSQNIVQTFVLTRTIRTSGMAILEALRGIVFSNVAARPTEFAQWYTALTTSGIPTYMSGIQFIAQQQAADPNLPMYRAYLSRVSPTSFDFTAVDLSSLQMLEIVAQGAHIAATYSSYGALTPALVASTAELRFLPDNLEQILIAVRDILRSSVEHYIKVNASISFALWCWFAGSMAVLIVGVVVFDQKLLKLFFVRQHIGLNLLEEIPRSTAADLVTHYEEAIEDFFSIYGLDDDSRGIGYMPNGVTGGGAGAHQNAEDEAVSKQDTATAAQSATSTRSHSFNIRVSMAGGVAIIALAVAAIYIFTLQTLNVSNFLQLVVDSARRRQDILAVRVLTREYFMASTAVKPETILTLSRSYLADIADLHQALTGPIGRLIPKESLWVRDCSPTSPLYCASMVEAPEIGWTRSLASVPLDTEIARFLQVATAVVDGMSAIPRLDPFDTSSAVYKQWQLMLALSNDLQVRMFNMHLLQLAMISDEINANQAGTVGMFALAIIVSVLFCGGVAGYVMVPLRADSKALVAALHQVPESALQKEARKLGNFIDSGGAALEMVSSTGDEDTG
ncbi:hypothetical protein BC828DRAFT_376546 [Blastocladiella britannica]|nr:hypothetical protein BC828DRAFT_376546 [Blastocladiella britannica]